jgi:hypothetical protein
MRLKLGVLGNSKCDTGEKSQSRAKKSGKEKKSDGNDEGADESRCVGEKMQRLGRIGTEQMKINTSAEYGGVRNK